jgi:hypothetical protein
MRRCRATFSRDREKVAAKQPDEGSKRHPGDAEDSFAHCVYIGPHFLIREANDIKAYPLQVLCSHAIGNAALVLRAVDFHDEFGLEADEIRNVAALRTLPPKL